ncbi:50S ribosomal L1 [Olea europaea subsp. europaea]|uniref:50S ribosomal L1 n=1 Tax=Olea europaea subsp. europaea TaxID=158383 RepID=A0A8S0RWG7_OLEEU|nr:50S ribosomal L1 [Olea europaea subsp. europaea]
MMEHVKKLSKILKQLMPDAKKGTVTNDISKTVKDAKAQSIVFKKDKTAIVHVGLGKVSYSEEALRENVGAFVNALLLAKPAGLKKSSKYAGYVDSFHICSTMGQYFPISIQSLSMAADHINRLQVQ